VHSTSGPGVRKEALDRQLVQVGVNRTPPVRTTASRSLDERLDVTGGRLNRALMTGITDATGTGGPAEPPAARAGGVVAGPDGRLRCPWPGTRPDYLAYHDDEWGRPVHDEVRLFEKLCLEGFQAGLSWLTILRKRSAFRRAFAGFDPVAVAAFGEDDVARLLTDAAIVRSRRKIESTVANARALLAMDGTLDDLVWGLAPTSGPAPEVMADISATTPESVALATELRSRGFRMVGPTTAYALMQACGVVNDHLAACFAREHPDTGPSAGVSGRASGGSSG